MTAASNSVRVVGRYALHQAIASGGMATVFVGRLQGPVGFARTVAIKRLHPQYASDPEFVAMFLDEARLAARIRHPNVVPTLDVVATKGELFLVMDYVHGESVSKLVRMAAEKGEPIPVRSLVSILSGALQGLDAAHTATSERGQPLHIVHRDVSPQNILLGTDGQPRLLDFGIARAMGRSHTTQQGTIKGKLAYMAPEQLRGDELSPATDLYSAGVVLWEALVGRRLYTGTHQELVKAVLSNAARPPSEALRALGEEQRATDVQVLDQVVMKALAPTVANRWQSAREFARALEHVLPPASAAQVSDWVQHIAGETLHERARIVAEIESNSAVDLTVGEIGRAIAAADDGVPSRNVPVLKGGLRKTLAMPGAPALPSGPDWSDLDKTIDDRVGKPGDGSRFAALPSPAWATGPMAPSPVSGASPARMPLAKTLLSVLPSDRRPSLEPPAPSSDGSVEITAPPRPSLVTSSDIRSRPKPSRARRKLIATGVGSGMVVIVVAALFVMGTGVRGTTGEAHSPTSAPAVSALGPVVSASPPAPAASAPVPSASAPSAMPPVAVPAGSLPADVPASPRDSHKHASGKALAPAPPVTSAAPVPNCNPAFTYDKDGLKHYKEECL